MKNLSRIEFFILEMLVSQGAMYGLQMVRESDGVLKRGTVYVTLNRMVEKGYVETSVSKDPYASGKPRPMYSATGHGQRTFQAQKRRSSEQGSMVPNPAPAGG